MKQPIRPRPAPDHPFFNDGIIDLALGLEHFEHFIAKQFMQIIWFRTRAFGESAFA
jgi:hypothetical protein